MSAIRYKVKPLKKGGDQSLGVARLDISVGMEYHEGEKLKATVDWAKRRFETVIVSVADSLQRYNLDNNYSLSMALGDQWLARNKDIIEGCRVQRWDDVIQHRLYDIGRVQDLYLRNTAFRLLIEDQIDSLKLQKAPRDASVEYLLEEIAGFAVLFKTQPAIDIYPGSFLRVWDAFRQNLIPQSPRILSSASTLQIGLLRRAA